MARPEVAATLEVLLWPVLGSLLYATFIQVPLAHFTAVFRERRFLVALLLGNFLIMPGIVGLLLFLTPNDPAIRLGVLLVLLVPCTDWFIGFTHLGGGDVRRAVAAAPVLLVVQLLLLPAYLWLYMGDLAIELAVSRSLLTAFAGLIVLPLILAWLTERVIEGHQRGQYFIQGLGWLPVPLLAIVVFLIAGSQVQIGLELQQVFWKILLVFLLYLLIAAAVGKLLSRVFKLGAPAGRTLTFSLGTRNSFVVLPLALTLPSSWHAAVVVIVFQSLVELFGMIAYLALMRRLIPAGGES